MNRRRRTIAEQVVEREETSKWISQTTDLLRQLNDGLFDTLQAWRSFNSPEKDIGYFCNTDAAAISLRDIDVVFLQLQRNEKRVDLLRVYCSNVRLNLSHCSRWLVTRE